MNGRLARLPGAGTWGLRRGLGCLVLLTGGALAPVAPAIGGEAAPRAVAVAPVEWRDYSALPPSAEGDATAARTTRLTAEALREHLASQDGVKVIAAEPPAEGAPEGGLFECASCSAELARELGADRVIVGQLNRVSGLISYLFLRAIDAPTGAVLADYRVELKGQAETVAPRAVANFVERLAALP